MVKETFKTQFKKFLVIQGVALSIPMVMYIYACSVQDQTLIYFSIAMLVVSQLLIAFYEHELLNIKDRLKEIFPTLTDKDVKYATLLTLTPVTSIVLFFFLWKGNEKSRKPLFVFVHPGKTILGFLIFGLVGGGPVRYWTMQPTTLYLADVSEEALTLLTIKDSKNVKVVDLMISKLEQPTTTGSVLMLAVMASDLMKRKGREPASDKKKIGYEYGLQMLEDTTKLIKHNESTDYFSRNINPMFFISPASMAELGLLMGIDHAIEKQTHESLMTNLDKLIVKFTTNLQKRDPAAVGYEDRIIAVQKNLESTMAYKSWAAKKNNEVKKL